MQVRDISLVRQYVATHSPRGVVMRAPGIRTATVLLTAVGVLLALTAVALPARSAPRPSTEHRPDLSRLRCATPGAAARPLTVDFRIRVRVVCQ